MFVSHRGFFAQSLFLAEIAEEQRFFLFFAAGVLIVVGEWTMAIAYTMTIAPIQ